VAQQAVEQYDAGIKSNRVYPAGVDDQKREAYDKAIAEGVPEEKLQRVFARLSELKGLVTPKIKELALYAMYANKHELTSGEYSIIIRNLFSDKGH
jgi:hypothetical protein